MALSFSCDPLTKSTKIGKSRKRSKNSRREASDFGGFGQRVQRSKRHREAVRRISRAVGAARNGGAGFRCKGARPWERRLQASLGDQFRSGAVRLVRMTLQTKSPDPAAFFSELSLDARLARFLRLRTELTGGSFAHAYAVRRSRANLTRLSTHAARRAASTDAIRPVRENGCRSRARR